MVAVNYKGGKLTAYFSPSESLPDSPQTQLLLNELTESAEPCLETAALYFAIFSFMDVTSSTDMGGPKEAEPVSQITPKAFDYARHLGLKVSGKVFTENRCWHEVLSWCLQLVSLYLKCVCVCVCDFKMLS